MGVMDVLKKYSLAAGDLAQFMNALYACQHS